MDAISATLEASRPDLVALQEAWEHGSRSQAALLGARHGMHHVYQGRPTSGGVSIGNAILSRWPIADSGYAMLPAPPELEELRNVLRARVAGPRGPLDVFCTHLNWRFDQSDIRQEQVRAIARFIATSAAEGMPPIL